MTWIIEVRIRGRHGEEVWRPLRKPDGHLYTFETEKDVTLSKDILLAGESKDESRVRRMDGEA
jgi:hypothetical protein